MLKDDLFKFRIRRKRIQPDIYIYMYLFMNIYRNHLRIMVPPKTILAKILLPTWQVASIGNIYMSYECMA